MVERQVAWRLGETTGTYGWLHLSPSGSGERSADREGLGVGDLLGLAEGAFGPATGFGDALPTMSPIVLVGNGVGTGVSDPVGVLLMPSGERLREGEGDGAARVGLLERVAVLVREGVRVSETEGVSDGVGVPVEEWDGVGVPVEEWDGVTELVPVPVGENEGDVVGVDESDVDGVEEVVREGDAVSD